MYAFSPGMSPSSIGNTASSVGTEAMFSNEPPDEEGRFEIRRTLGGDASAIRCVSRTRGGATGPKSMTEKVERVRLYQNFQLIKQVLLSIVFIKSEFSAIRNNES